MADTPAAVADRPPVIGPGQTPAVVTAEVSDIVLKQPVSEGWVAALLASAALVFVLAYAIAYLLVAGVGIWGINIPVGWGFAIINFVWWIGIGHAGTLISAILLLLHQQWRTSINRVAETMTLAAVTCAGLFPLLHMGRPWFFYWMFPYPGTAGVWPQFRSPLVWDMVAILVYFVVSFLFWYTGLIPDLATLRDRARGRFAGRAYGLLCLGWRGNVEHWHRHRVAYVLLAGLATPLVISVHTIVAYDFAASVLPGWHSLIFPPYFVIGAMFSGLAMVLVLLVPIRHIYKLHPLITDRHMNNLAKLTLATGMLVGYGYFSELWMAWYGGKRLEWYVAMTRMFGPSAAAYWALMACNLGAPQLLWSARLRARPVVLWLVGVVVLVGMWLERYVILVSSQHRDFLPSAWGPYDATVWDWLLFLGTFGLFFALLLLFLRFLPMIPIYEVRELRPRAEVRHPSPT